MANFVNDAPATVGDTGPNNSNATPPPATLCEAFQRTVAHYGDRVALRDLGGAQITWHHYAQRVRSIAAGLAQLGVEHGDTVALMLGNRPEAFLVDTAALHIGATPFSIYNTSSPEQLAYLIGHAESRVVFTENAFAARVEQARGALPKLEHVIVIDRADGLAALEAGADPDFDFDSAWRSSSPDDVAVLIYTSGTTGAPKGVELTHANLVHEFNSVQQWFPIDADSTLVSYLPQAHIADRALSYYPALFTGASTTCVLDQRDVISALPQIRPAMWLGVPRIWEKLKAALETTGETGEDPVALRERLGMDRAGVLFSGAAPIAAEILEFFATRGITICEGWSMSETSCLGAYNRPDSVRIGTVGRAAPGLEITVAYDGELLLRGPCVMRGYRNDPQRTAEAIDTYGWLHSGDLGEIDADGYVRIIGRKKELIINAAGKNMSPNHIENAVKAESPLIGPIMAVGDRRPYLTALIVLDPVAAAGYASAHGIIDADPAALADNADVRAEVAAAIERANSRLNRAEQIKRFTILHDDWPVGGDELTPTMKMQRARIAEKYAPVIASMYEQ
jgi:long-chain acyl-CoA synthetase